MIVCTQTTHIIRTHCQKRKKERKKSTGAGEMALAAHLEADFPKPLLV